MVAQSDGELRMVLFSIRTSDTLLLRALMRPTLPPAVLGQPVGVVLTSYKLMIPVTVTITLGELHAPMPYMASLSPTWRSLSGDVDLTECDVILLIGTPPPPRVHRQMAWAPFTQTQPFAKMLPFR